jgi:Uncharacterized conserved protein
MNELLLQLFTAFLGSLGFAMLFGLHRRHLLTASLGGLLVWGLYLLADSRLHSLFLSNLLASAFAVLYAEFHARRLKCPATLFVLPGIVPLVPGGSLYYAMSFAVRQDLEQASQYGTSTLVTALAIAAGISFVMACRELHTRR